MQAVGANADIGQPHVDGVALRDLFGYPAESPPAVFTLHVPEDSLLDEWDLTIPGDHLAVTGRILAHAGGPLSKVNTRSHFSSSAPILVWRVTTT